MHSARVLVVGEHGRRAESLCVLLRALHDVESVGHTESLTTASQTIVEFRPTVVVVDAGLPESDCRALLERIAIEHPAIGRMALVVNLEQAQAARAAGAAAVLTAPATLDMLEAAITQTQLPPGAAA